MTGRSDRREWLIDVCRTCGALATQTPRCKHGSDYAWAMLYKKDLPSWTVSVAVVEKDPPR